MSLKIKITWNDDNIISDGARIYKSNVAFTPTTLPPLYDEVGYGVEIYEDLNVTEDQTYFYMLSSFLDEQEAFTKCYEVQTSKPSARLTYVAGSIVKNAPSSASSAASIAAYEPNQSTPDKIVIAIVSTQSAMSTPDGWTLLSSKLNTYVFWRRGGNPGLLRTFSVNSPSQLSVYMFLLQPSDTFTLVECVSLLSSKGTTAINPAAPSPILPTAIDKHGYEIMLGKPQYAHVENSDGLVSDGYTMITTNMKPQKNGSAYHADLIIGGRARDRGEQVGGGVITQINAYQPSILFMQTIQICVT